MISGIGTDIIEIEKIKNYSKRKSFINKIFTKREIDYAKKKEDFVSHLATTFAAKEAIFKALGTGWLDGKEIEIIRNSKGKPRAVVNGSLRNLVGGDEISISLSYNNHSAVAFVVIEKKKK